MPAIDPFSARDRLSTPLGEREIVRLDALDSLGDIGRLPVGIKVLLESCLRNLDGRVVTEEHVRALAGYQGGNVGEQEIAFMPGRVVLQDFTGVPCVVDLAAMRAAMVALGGDPSKVNPLVPCDLVIDHSVQVDAFNSGVALTINSRLEFERNHERYEFLKWGQSALGNFRVVPPATGIVHQVNLEYLAKVVWDDGVSLYPDSLVGTDSHTTMINGLGVVGWGVGGIEAEAVMLGQPCYMLIPEVVGVRLVGRLAEGSTATDLVLRVTEVLRNHGVVGKFVEFFGPGLAEMPLANRATIANMAPEYGATVGLFPIDEQTIRYMELTARDADLCRTVEQYAKLQGLWRNDEVEASYADVLEIDMSSIRPALAGPRRPQDRVELDAMRSQWHRSLSDQFGKEDAVETVRSDRWAGETGTDEAEPAAVATAAPATARVELGEDRFELRHGDVVVAAITSCTNTSNPSVMIGAGLLARNAVARGLVRKPWVKTSLAPGSRVVTDYLAKAELMDDLEKLGFFVVGYGCTTCIGNSGPIPEPIREAIVENDLVVASVLSGNRNFEGRIHADIKANYLASPPLVVAYAIAGTVDIDLTSEPIGHDADGKPVFLRELWPSETEIQELLASSVTREQFETQYASVFEGSEEWRAVETSGGGMYEWNDESTYIQDPPFFAGMSASTGPIESIRSARCLVKVGDSVTTDHISPAGAIKADSPAGAWLIERGVSVSEFNSYGSRRGNDRIMTRGTFANVRLRNQLAPGTEGGFTTDFTDGAVKTIFEASENYRAASTPLVVLAGRDYGMGSSRDWAAKGTRLLGVRAVIAQSFERIHRSNLVFMGVLPLTFSEGENAETLGLDGSESFSIELGDDLEPRRILEVVATHPERGETRFKALCRVDTPVEVDYYRHGGILPFVLRKMAGSD